MAINFNGAKITGATIGNNYTPSPGDELYSFSSFTFTSANVAGRAGPTLSQCLANYNTVTNTWLNDINYFNVPVQGIQLWTVPKTGIYRITAAGARGGKSHFANLEGGFGAQIIADISLTKNETIAIVVGQEGRDRSNVSGATFLGGGGGGGTFVYNNTTTTYYVVAGGGGGAASTRTGILTNQNTAHGRGNTIHGTNVTIQGGFIAFGGRDGKGANVSNRNMLYGGPGAGILSDGQSANGLQGRSKNNNWIGGNVIVNSPNSVQGGFGGGAASGNGDNNATNVYAWSGGGGGYSGGGSGGNGGASDGQYGGGGGSYVSSGYVSNVSGINNSNGYVVITFIS
ncbi:MAG: hypothetical protein EB127_05405 [Alphaproteobacteria bacterium]|nr:hypothetical protein [Alphaproteobacteria bacterium]